MKKISDLVPIRSIVYLVVCIVIIAAFVLLVIFPSYNSLGKLDREIANVKTRMIRQKALLPLYIELVRKSEAAVPHKYSIPESKEIPKNNIDLIPSLLKGVSRKSGVELVLVNPDFTTLAKGEGSILINTVVRGDFFSFREFLIELGKVPYLKELEEIEILQRATDKEFKMKIWLAVG